MTEQLKAAVTLARYQFPAQLLPEFHAALYQLLVGVEQQHSAANLKAYAERLRPLADQAFATADAVPTEPRQLEQRGYLIEWPGPGGKRGTVWSNSDVAAKAIGCPFEPVYALRAAAPQPATESPSMSILVCLTCRHVDSSISSEPRDSCINSAQNLGSKYTRWQAK